MAERHDHAESVRQMVRYIRAMDRDRDFLLPEMRRTPDQAEAFAKANAVTAQWEASAEALIAEAARFREILTYRGEPSYVQPEIRQALETAIRDCSANPPYGAGFKEALRRYDDLVDWRLTPTAIAHEAMPALTLGEAVTLAEGVMTALRGAGAEQGEKGG